MTDLTIRSFEPRDRDALWRVLEPVFRAGDTYAIDTGITRDDAIAYWTGSGRQVYSAILGGQFSGSYYLVRNQGGGGSHVCNCGFVTDPAQKGRGVARRMLEHALHTARTSGYRAMQFNFVVSTNTRAVGLWERGGFDIVGRLPQAFLHPSRGYVDALVMYKTLVADVSAGKDL
ncbi:GNAT family N-acetyltransferase [Salipiger aestuarii]|uniref:Ribosomal protein S18 acetylase RimI-like enzyme n=1 Tax=Salipiger aestuarii TaxID=568098 RepID=A0A327YBX1_9RHOB|nr:N-acetyltransferase [Salipiger aestuarii]EIE51349.1 N-acetyltransferase [Citreicella sp. 357]RAK18324.1 ribosomal protein S18 acetylase RimI-like enzyme [Salipiger aestuarii]